VEIYRGEATDDPPRPIHNPVQIRELETGDNNTCTGTHAEEYKGDLRRNAQPREVWFVHSQG